MSRKIDLSGRVFGRLIVIARCVKDSRFWICRCECGKPARVYRGNLHCGDSRSCGCIHAEMMVGRNETHGLSNRPEYSVWAGMKKRCYNPKFQQFVDYGGRGITVCDRWRDNFPAFFADMGPRPTATHTIDRIDNDGPYSPENCAWIPRFDQAKNRRRPIGPIRRKRRRSE